jgi:transcriptional regulator with XRE-family HTH domain
MVIISCFPFAGSVMFTKNKTNMNQKTTIPREYKLKIGANVRKWRSLKSIKQKQLADSLNLSEAAVSNIENDLTNINLRQLEDIANAIDVRVEQLLSDPEDSYRIMLEKENSKPDLFEKELLSAMIGSLRKKDEQLEKIMENVLRTMAAYLNSKDKALS